jgi:hypothetical protein
MGIFSKKNKEIIDNKEKWEILVERVTEAQYGDIILHQDIEALIDLGCGDLEYYSLITKVKKYLFPKGIGLVNIKGIGYRVLEPDAFNEKSAKVIKHGSSVIKKGLKWLEYAPTKDMSPEGRETHRTMSDSAKRINAMMVGGCSEIRLLNNLRKLKVEEK